MSNKPAGPADLGALSHLAPELARTFASVAGDIALVVDVSGVVRNVALGGAQPLPTSGEEWIGRHWAETASDDSRAKIDMLLQEAVDVGIAQRREVNLPVGGVDIPVAYTAIRLGEYGPVLAVGRDLRAVAAIQQRFVDAQQQMEREYWKKRQAESRYRTLFHVATDAVLVVDPQSLQIVEANHAAARLFDVEFEELAGRPVTAGIDRATRPAVEAALAQARTTGQPAQARARLTTRLHPISISAAPFRNEGALQLLVRAHAIDSEPQDVAPLAELVERIPDGVVIADGGGRILMANPAFVEMCGMADEARLRGVALDRWLGVGEDGVNGIFAQLRSRAFVPPFGAGFRVADGTAFQVEVSAALLDDADQERIGFTVRRVADRGPMALPLFDGLSRSVQRLSMQMGHEPLPGLLRQVTDLAERHLIGAAIERAGGDLDAAAALLGVSRHSLELRLQRHGFTPGESDSRRLGDQTD